ncbi:MAG: ribbon-helix-helix protein, CopG family [Myxococcota bacterium]
MANLTITVDEDLLKRARIRALEQGTSVNALLREYLEAYAGDDRVRAAREGLVELARTTDSGSGPHGRRWSRDELHER